MRLNGAEQLANSGLKESSVVFAKETYRKYPDTKQIPQYRIFFADILYEKGMYEEALGEYFEIEKLELTKEEKTKVESHVNAINKILLNDGDKKLRKTYNFANNFLFYRRLPFSLSNSHPNHIFSQKISHGG
jgi:hypothetical protein